MTELSRRELLASSLGALAFPLASRCAEAPEPAKLHTGFKFTEGPAADHRGNLYFTDIPNNRIHKSDADGKLSTFFEDSKACNGLMIDSRGRLVACQGGEKRVVAIDLASKAVDVLAYRCDGKPVGTPNDLVIDQTGGTYFTAPDIGSVFYVSSIKKVTRVLADLPRPNGVILSPDEQTLYVLPSGSGDVLAYPVERPGAVGTAAALCKLEPAPNNPGRPGGDGLAVDTRGNLYLTRPVLKTIFVVDPAGKTLQRIKLPEEPSNCVFGGRDMKTLFVTASSSVYAAAPGAVGHRFAGPRAGGALPEGWDYAAPMRKVAARFNGTEGVVIHVGGSMTIANPYGTWARSGKGKTKEDEATLKWMHTEAKDKTDGWWLCRTELEHYRAYTSESGLKVGMLFGGGKRNLPTLAKMLDDYRPRMVTIECGIYDVEDNTPLDDYRKGFARALDAIVEKGAIPLPNTIPPFKAQLARTRSFNDAIRELCAEKGVPLLDLEREIFARRPDDWFNQLADRIHLTAGQAGVSPGAEPTPENLARSGYLLRCWLTVRKVAEIKARVIDR
ncbi:MAG: SMP-30/gluconolactonase/LRE family protein [Gemmata sp.]